MRGPWLRHFDVRNSGFCTTSLEVLMSTTEFAPEYTTAERTRFIALDIVLVSLLFVPCQLWFFPWLREFSASAHCRYVFGIKGTSVLFFGLFVGLPLHAAMIVMALIGRRGYKVLRDGQVPPKGEKVFRPTAIHRGVRAKFSGWAQFLSSAPLLALAVWGGPQAQALIAQADRVTAKCASNTLIERTVAGKPAPAAYVSLAHRPA